MKRTEAQKRMYKILNQYLKPNQRAGLAQIEVPITTNEGNTEFKTVTVKEKKWRKSFSHTSRSIVAKQNGHHLTKNPLNPCLDTLDSKLSSATNLEKEKRTLTDSM
jgi:hypothetical protein